ncbi:MAG: sulfatase-like hydrolase/transferase [Myxococcota bacterium]
MPRILTFALSLALGMSAACKRAAETSPAPESTSTSSSPNVLLITVDTLRADHLGSYGYDEARTPVADRFAKEGVRVERAIAPTPLTLPSHTTIMTGLEPPAHSVRGNGVFRVPDSVQTLAEVLKAEGYETQAFVSADVLHRRFNLDQGFDGYDDVLSSGTKRGPAHMLERPGAQTMDRVLGWFKERTSSASPFFLWVHLFDPHEPYEPPPADAKLAATPYDGEITSADRQVGRLIEALEPNGVLDNTILVFTSDHGENLGEHEEGTHAMFIYEATQRVPLIFRYPSKLPAGKVYDGPVRSVDIMPTVLSLAGMSATKTQGHDLSAALASGTVSESPVQYSESYYPELMFGMAALEGLREGDWTYIRAPRPELYDRSVDPGEVRNLLDGGGSPAAKARALELESALTGVIEESQQFASVAQAKPLDPQTAAMLKSLGYMSDSGAVEDLGGVDPKDGIRVVNEVRAAKGLEAGDCATVARSVLKRLPGYVHAWNILGECEQRAGDLDAARKAFFKSLSYQPKQPKVHLQLGHIDLSQGRSDSARGHYTQALDLMPDLVDAILAMASLDAREGKPDSAIGWYERAVGAEPGRKEPYLHIAEFYFRKGQFEQAQDWYRKTLEVAPEYTYIASLRGGVCALQLGDPKGAKQQLRRASDAWPARPDPHYHLACAESQQGNREAAVGALQTAVAKGFRNVSKLQSDACLQPLATEPGFQNLVSTLGGGAQR